MKILKLRLFQETACYKKPFAFKFEETYPLPPYSTVIGMLHKILGAKSGEYYPMNISIQGDYESLNLNYIRKIKFATEKKKREYKRKYNIDMDATTAPFYTQFLFNVNLIIHVKAEDDIIDKIYNNIISGKESFTLGRNEDLVRIDGISYVQESDITNVITNHNAYVFEDDAEHGIYFRLNYNYKLKDDLRVFDKVNVRYVEKETQILKCKKDNENDLIFFIK